MSPSAKVLRQSHSIYHPIGKALVCLGFCLLIVGQSISIQAQTTRNFRMSLWGDPSGADVDTPIYYEGQTQPQGRSIFGLGSWNVDNFANVWASLRANNDFTRVDAVLIDEPYWNVSGASDWSNPCRNPSDPRNSAIQTAATRIANDAAIIRQTFPAIRFWINFSEPEVQWMKDEGCPLTLNRSYIDVVSMDVYFRSFSPDIRAYYDWITGHRAYAGQQIGLVPGTFFRSGVDDPNFMASLLQGFFDYANQVNQSCNLPLGSAGVTGNSDGCLLWMVAGWFAGPPIPDNGTTWYGELDPASGPIHAAWEGQRMNHVLDPMLGNVESWPATAGLNRGIITGWAIDRKTPQTPVYVDFWVDGQFYAGGTRGDIYRQDVANAYGIGTAGYTFKIPDQYWDGASHRVDVYAVAPSAEGWNHILLASNNFVLDHTPDPMFGNVEAINVNPGTSPYTISGWAIDQATPNTPVYVDFWVDGVYWGGTRGTIFRQDIYDIYGISQSGYVFTIPQQFVDGGCHHVDVYAVAPTAEGWNHVLLPSYASPDFCFP